MESLRHALRDVVARCVYGVDLNPMAVELAKVSLWLEALDPGKPLSFLDAHIKHGNALIGATPKLIDGGIPAGAFKPIEGDDPKFAKSLERANAAQPVLTAGQRRVARFSASPTLPGLEPQSYQEELFSDEIIFSQSNAALAAGLARIARPAGRLAARGPPTGGRLPGWEESAENQAQAPGRRRLVRRLRLDQARRTPPRDRQPRLHRTCRRRGGSCASRRPRSDRDRAAARGVRLLPLAPGVPGHLPRPTMATRHADRDTGWSGGFTCVLANPPWDKVDFEDKKYFSVVEPSIADMAGQARRVRIAEWEKEHEDEGKRYRSARRKVKGTFGFASSSGAYPRCAKGLTAPGVNSLQTDQLFAERFATITAPTGRVGCIIPTAIATGAGGQYLFGDFTERGAVASLYDFENRKAIFPGVHASYKFCLLSLTGKALREPAARFAFFLLDTAELDDRRPGVHARAGGDRAHQPEHRDARRSSATAGTPT